MATTKSKLGREGEVGGNAQPQHIPKGPRSPQVWTETSMQQWLHLGLSESWGWVHTEKTGCICPPSALFSVLPNPALPRHLLQPFVPNRMGKFTAVWPRRLQTIREMVEENRAEHSMVLYQFSKEDYLAHFHFAWLLGQTEEHQAKRKAISEPNTHILPRLRGW